MKGNIRPLIVVSFTPALKTWPTKQVFTIMSIDKVDKFELPQVGLTKTEFEELFQFHSIDAKALFDIGFSIGRLWQHYQRGAEIIFVGINNQEYRLANVAYSSANRGKPGTLRFLWQAFEQPQ